MIIAMFFLGVENGVDGFWKAKAFSIIFAHMLL